MSLNRRGARVMALSATRENISTGAISPWLVPPAMLDIRESSHGRSANSELADRPLPGKVVGPLMVLSNEKSEVRDQVHRLLGKNYLSVKGGLQSDTHSEMWALWDAFAEAPSPMALLSGPDHRFTFANAAYCRLVDREGQEIVGKAARDVRSECEGQLLLERLDHVYCAGEPFSATKHEVKLCRRGKDEFIYLNFTYYPMRDAAGRTYSVLFFGVDITQQVLSLTRSEARFSERTAELEQAQQELRELRHKLGKTQDEERRRLARELHDSAGQWLAALKWKMVPLADDLESMGSDLGNRALECVNMLDELTKELRTLSHLLHPPLVEEAGLRAALQGYVDGLVERSGLEVSLELSPELSRLPAEIETNVFRIIQEALTNIQLHARTRTAKVRVERNSETLRVEVQDQGRGIPGFTLNDDGPLKLGVGLRGIRERVRQMHGTFELVSGLGGTRVVAIIPYQLAQN